MKEIFSNHMKEISDIDKITNYESKPDIIMYF